MPPTLTSPDAPPNKPVRGDMGAILEFQGWDDHAKWVAREGVSYEGRRHEPRSVHDERGKYMKSFEDSGVTTAEAKFAEELVALHDKYPVSASHPFTRIRDDRHAMMKDLRKLIEKYSKK